MFSFLPRLFSMKSKFTSWGSSSFYAVQLRNEFEKVADELCSENYFVRARFNEPKKQVEFYLSKRKIIALVSVKGEMGMPETVEITPIELFSRQIDVFKKVFEPRRLKIKVLPTPA